MDDVFDSKKKKRKRIGINCPGNTFVEIKNGMMINVSFSLSGASK